MLLLLKSLKKGAFGVTYFRDIYSGVNDKFYKTSWEELKELKCIDKRYYSSDFYDVSVNKYSVKCGTSLRFLGGKKAGLMELIHMVGFNGILDIGREEDLQMIRDKLIDGVELLVDLRVF